MTFRVSCFVFVFLLCLLFRVCENRHENNIKKLGPSGTGDASVDTGLTSDSLSAALGAAIGVAENETPDVPATSVGPGDKVAVEIPGVNLGSASAPTSANLQHGEVGVSMPTSAVHNTGDEVEVEGAAAGVDGSSGIQDFVPERSWVVVHFRLGYHSCITRFSQTFCHANMTKQRATHNTKLLTLGTTHVIAPINHLDKE